MIRQRAFAAVSRQGWVWTSSCRLMASEARQYVGEQHMMHDDRSWREGWERAKRDGYRIKVVLVTVAR